MRKHGIVKTTIWSDPEFLALGAAAQRVYLMALTQPNLSHAGVVDYTPRRWSTLAQGDSPARVRRAVAELAGSRFVTVDEDTEELLVRTLIRHDRALRSPNIAKALTRDVERIRSVTIREAVEEELYRHFLETSTDPAYTIGWDTVGYLITDQVRKGLPEPLPEPLPEGFPEAFAKGVV